MNALVLGGAGCISSDLDTVPDGWADIVVVTNRTGFWYPGPIHHWVTLHPESLADWTARRPDRHYTTWGYQPDQRVQRWIKPWAQCGSSGLLAAQVAIEVGATNVVLCGIPVECTPHIPGIGYTDEPWVQAWSHQRYWRDNAWRMTCVRSCGGWTAELLGRPSWLSPHE